MRGCAGLPKKSTRNDTKTIEQSPYAKLCNGDGIFYVIEFWGIWHMNRKKYIFEVYNTCCQQNFILISDVDLGW